MPVKKQIPISKAVNLYGQEEISKLVDLRLAEDDTMINQDGDPNFHLPHYLSVGANALAIIKSVMKAAGRDSVDSILDYAGGHGRVMRWLVAAFPRTKIYGRMRIKNPLFQPTKCSELKSRRSTRPPCQPSIKSLT